MKKKTRNKIWMKCQKIKILDFLNKTRLWIPRSQETKPAWTHDLLLYWFTTLHHYYHLYRSSWVFVILSCMVHNLTNLIAKLSVFINCPSGTRKCPHYRSTTYKSFDASIFTTPRKSKKWIFWLRLGDM